MRVDESGKMTGRNEREWGQMGVKRIAGTVGARMDPPADMLYAVDPVGVAMRIPSACTVVSGTSSCTTQTERRGRRCERKKENEPRQNTKKKKKKEERGRKRTSLSR